jgi:uncharacterized membrane protein YfcA
MTGAEMLAVAAGGFGAGALTASVGSGSLLSFPVLLAVGLPPVPATITNSLGLVAGGVTGSLGYRRELAPIRRWLPGVLTGSLLGGLSGAWLLLNLPASTFAVVVPWLIGVAALLVAVQPRLNRLLARRRTRDASVPAGRGQLVALGLSTYATGTYGGYFSASQGVLTMAVAGLIVPTPVQQLNALKVTTTLTVNVVAAAAYVLAAPDLVMWTAAGLMTVGSLAGGWAGARVGRRLPAPALRAGIVALALVAIAILVDR